MSIGKSDLAARLAETGQQVVLKHFNIQRTAEQIEHYPLDLADGNET